MATFTKFNCFVEDLAKKLHNLETDSFRWYLTNTAPDAAADLVLTDLPTETANGNGYTTGGLTADLSTSRTTGTLTVSQAGTAPVLTASGAVGAFRYLCLYNFTATGKNVVGYLDHGSTINMVSPDTYTIPNGSLFTIA